MNKSSTIVIVEYSDYSNIFLKKIIVKLPKYTKINNNIIKLEENKQ